MSAVEAASAASESGAGRPREGATALAAARASEASSVPSATQALVAKPSDDLASDPRVVARRVLDDLAGRRGPAMADANARGCLFAEFGPELAAAFEEFRECSGGTGNPAPFREALRERWGIDLTPPLARGG